MKDKIDELAMNSKNKNIRDLYRGINEIKKGYQPRSNFLISFFKYLVCEAIGTAATPGLLCHPRVIVKMIVEKQMECRLAGETEALRENLP
jgi:hypothetical protein